MLQIGDVIVSFDVLTKEFSCDLSSCHGACCVEGDAGAPVTPDEVAQIEELLPVIWDALDPEARRVIEQAGVSCLDPEGETVTQIVNGKDCVFTCHGEDGSCYCAIEKAYREGRCSFMKPVSCHLYPIRVRKLGGYWGLNYDRWDVCRAAVLKGQREHIPVYKYLEGPLVRRFGRDWFDELELTVSEMKKQNII
ncbi:MAG: DUF3109 family protein [Bacteroidaceae bacterium]|nr:DUF3109 family protein [Bacteroidaceae bacterium]